jgi:hypothetical protein
MGSAAHSDSYKTGNEGPFREGKAAMAWSWQLTLVLRTILVFTFTTWNMFHDVS